MYLLNLIKVILAKFVELGKLVKSWQSQQRATTDSFLLQNSKFRDLGQIFQVAIPQFVRHAIIKLNADTEKETFQGKVKQVEKKVTTTTNTTTSKFGQLGRYIERSLSFFFTPRIDRLKDFQLSLFPPPFFLIINRVFKHVPTYLLLTRSQVILFNGCVLKIWKQKFALRQT